MSIDTLPKTFANLRETRLGQHLAKESGGMIKEIFNITGTNKDATALYRRFRNRNRRLQPQFTLGPRRVRP